MDISREHLAAQLGGRIRAVRKACGLSMEELADLLGTSRPTVSEWENGKGLPDTLFLARLARALGADAHGLLFGGAAKPALVSDPTNGDRLQELQEVTLDLTEVARRVGQLDIALQILLGAEELSETVRDRLRAALGHDD